MWELREKTAGREEPGGGGNGKTECWVGEEFTAQRDNESNLLICWPAMSQVFFLVQKKRTSPAVLNSNYGSNTSKRKPTTTNVSGTDQRVRSNRLHVLI